MMLDSLFYIVLAILGLSFLIFIHELGHYWMARRVGMKVDTFSIGIGKPIYSWEHDGVKWQIGWLLFGGYVKIGGTETEGETEVSPYDIPDGFYGKGPWARIKVAFMGPFVNLVFAFVVFGILWSMGGREQNYAEVTSKMGWVDPHSDLYAKGARPGDEVLSYDGRLFQRNKDHLYAAMTGASGVQIRGAKLDYDEGKNSFEFTVIPYQNPLALKKGIMTLGILAPANYLIYNRPVNDAEPSLPEGSPLHDKGLEYGDRLIWVDGVLIFSSMQLDHVLNDNRVLLTVQRAGKVFLVRAPRVHVDELKLDPSFKEELIDWQFEAELNNIKMQDLYAIPYNLTNDCVVENELKFIDKDKESEAFPKTLFSDIEQPLLPEDKILAIDGMPVTKSYELLKGLQTRQVNIIVQRNHAATQKISWEHSDVDFDRYLELKNIDKIAKTIGTDNVISSAGDFVLLKPVTPKKMQSFFETPEKKAQYAAEALERKKEIEKIEDSEMRAQLLQALKKQENRMLIGFPYQDRKINYNPSPMTLFYSVFGEIWQTLTALLTGSLNLKWMSGPIGIVQVVQQNWMVSAKEALFWIGAISLNLGVLNLLPIPVLDGGTILMAFVEMVTRRRMSPKNLERVILPFAVLLIAFFMYVTYYDLKNLFGNFLR